MTSTTPIRAPVSVPISSYLPPSSSPSSLPTNVGTFAYDSRAVILPAVVVGIPIAVEIINLCIEVYKDPTVIKRNLLKLKTFVCDSFEQRPNEGTKDYRQRLAKNIAITLLAVSILAASALCPFFVLPTALAIPVALMGIHAAILGLQYIPKIPESLRKAKDYLVDSFTQRPDELRKDFHTRRLKAILKIVAYTALFAAVVVAGIYGAQLAVLLSKASPWALYDVLPFQTPLVVFLEYAAVGILHVLVGIKELRAGNTKQAIFHFLSALASLAFPIWYILDDPANMRLHHSFIGLVLQLAPWRPVQAFGAAVTVDSSLYAGNTSRGYYAPNIKGELAFHSYDFMNTVVENIPFVLLALAALSLMQKGLDHLLSPEKTTSKTEESVGDIQSTPVKQKGDFVAGTARLLKKRKEQLINQKERELFLLEKEAFRHAFVRQTRALKNT